MAMLPPEMALKNVRVGDGDLIGRDNLENFFGHISGLRDFPDKSIVELTSSYDSGMIMLVQELEAKFVNLNPIIQQMFFQLDNMERRDDRDFVLKTLTREFEDIAKEARKIFAHYDIYPGSSNICHILKK